MSELVRTSESAVATTGDEPVTDVALCVEPEGLLVYGDQNAVAKYVAELRGLVSDAIDTADVSPVVAGHGAAAATAGMAIASHAGQFVRLAPTTVKALEMHKALPAGNGYFRGTLVNDTGKFAHQVQWQPVTMTSTRLMSIQMLAMQVALASAIASVEKSVERIEGQVELVLKLAEASRAGDIRGHHVVLSRLTKRLDENQVLTNTDWESVAALGPELVVTVERLREHIKRTLAGFDPTKPVHERADYLRRAVEDNRLGETLHLLVVSEQSLYLWQRLRIARVQATEPEDLQSVLGDAREILAENAEQDGMLLHDAREHLAEYAQMNRLDGFRWGAAHNLTHDIVKLQDDLDKFAAARGRQVTEWVASEQPSAVDALSEVGSIALSVGGSAASAAARALGAGLGFMGRGIGQLVGGSPDEDKLLIEQWSSDQSTGALLGHVRRGALRPGDALTFRDSSTGSEYIATVTAAGGITFEGRDYGDPSAPLIESFGRARNGWRDWRLADGRSLRSL